jgi:hypothetical protein
MNKGLIIFLIIFAVVAGIVTTIILTVHGTGKTTTSQTNRVFYYGSTCPHCKIVEEFIKANNVKTKYDFSEKEVYGSKSNADELIKRGRECGLDENSVGAVPMFWNNGTCIVGDQPIIDFFKQQIGVSNESSGSSVSSSS